mgnify:CR=1 FL=1|tara:strand:+ start:768 stop:1457 length:690 start_codon:yes stop_codon:yes gene_type:complete
MNDIIDIKTPLDLTKHRFGRSNDGGYVIAMDDFKYDLLIGCGIGDDISFEDDFLTLYEKVKCIVYDGTISHLPKYRSAIKNRIEWKKENVLGKNIDLSGKQIFLKMDIEGGEYKFLEEMTNNDFRKLAQIVMEFHSGGQWGDWDEYKIKCIKKIFDTHYLIHFHSNNNSPLKHDVDCLNSIPCVWEGTFIRKDLIGDFVDNEDELPTKWDEQNQVLRADYKLCGFPYIR